VGFFSILFPTSPRYATITSFNKFTELKEVGTSEVRVLTFGLSSAFATQEIKKERKKERKKKRKKETKNDILGPKRLIRFPPPT